MPRKKKLKIGCRPMPLHGHKYLVCVEEIDIVGNKVVVQLRHISPEFEGQRYCLERSVPVNPEGLVAVLLRASGVDVKEETEIDYQEVIGQVVNAEFGRSINSAVEVVGFEPFVEEVNHGSNT
jgi:hypothetical protein